MSRELKYEDYTVAWICALPFEATAAMFMLDSLHGGEFPWRSGQESIYTAGSLNGHNVVIACLPKGEYAIGAAARVVGQLRLCFPNLTFGLMVGIGAGVPSPKHDIRLGDVVVGVPEDASGGCVGYDLGKETVDGFRLKGWLNATEPALRSAIAHIEARAGRHGDVFVQNLEAFRGSDPRGRKFLHPGLDKDVLYHALRTNEIVERPLRDHLNPVVHYGLIASGNSVIKNAILRDELRDRHNIICFEMEAASLMNTLPVAMIRGISDYADSHKNDNWQHYAAATAAAYAKGLLKVIRPGSTVHIKTDASGGNSSPNPLREPSFMLPYTHNPDFVGRNDILEQLQNELLITGEHQPRAVLWGLGGIGKSQIAIQYAYWHRKIYPEQSVFWIHASSVARFHQGFSEAAREFKVPGFDDPKANHLVLMKSWLSNQRNGKWLMIIDNADDADVFFNRNTTIADSGNHEVTSLNKYIPECSNGAILVTTRTKIIGQKLARGRCLIKVSPMNEVESAELFRKQLVGEILKTNELSELARELDGLPLALAQAAAFIQMNSLTVHDYLKLYKESDDMKIRLFSEHFEAPGRDSKVPNPVAATWMISFEHIKHTTPCAARILSVMAFLDRHGIPESLVRDEASDRMELTKALGVLKAFSLISANEADNTFNMHRLVYLAIRNWLSLNGEFEVCALSCLEKMCEEFPSGDYETLDTCDLYLPHATAALKYKEFSRADDVSWAHLAFRISGYLENRGSYNSATLLAEQALGRYMKVLGEEHLRTLGGMGKLAKILEYQGKYDKAEEMSRRTLEVTERVLGKKHPGTLVIMGILASVLARQGKYDEAEAIGRWTLEVMETVLGEEHSDILVIISNFMSVLTRQGKYDEAKEIGRRTLKIRERVLGKEHPDTIESINNIAVVLENQGKYDEAEEMHYQKLELFKKVKGKEHPDTLGVMHNLALVLTRRGKYCEAEEMYQQALKLEESVLGEEHPNTLLSIYCLAHLLQKQKRYNESSVLYQRALSGFQEKLGSDHPHSLHCSRNYSSLLKEMDLSHVRDHSCP